MLDISACRSVTPRDSVRSWKRQEQVFHVLHCLLHQRVLLQCCASSSLVIAFLTALSLTWCRLALSISCFGQRGDSWFGRTGDGIPCNSTDVLLPSMWQVETVIHSCSLMLRGGRQERCWRSCSWLRGCRRWRGCFWLGGCIPTRCWWWCEFSSWSL